MTKKVLVSGCFDMMHSGHIAFFRTAATYGDLYVALGSDKTILELKGRLPVNTEAERVYVVQSVGCVKSAFVSKGSGILDFESELRSLKPDIFVVNADGNTPQKEALVKSLGVEYIVLERLPDGDLPVRSTTSLRKISHMPYRIDLAGGWLDQPFVSKFCSGAVITISIEPTVNFNERSGMATSTRNNALELWGDKIPVGPAEKLAKVLFCFDNPPGRVNISGAQDSIGIVLTGVNYSYFEGQYWPSRIDRIFNEDILAFIEKHIYLIPLDPRAETYDPLVDTHFSEEKVKALSAATDECWAAIKAMDAKRFGAAVTASFNAQVAMFPKMLTPEVMEAIERYKDQVLGYKISGAGGGGYVIFISEAPIKPQLKVCIRRDF